MCGIAGWIDYNGVGDCEGVMRAMAQTLAPRGPDSDGFYFSECCTLAHRRLAVIDPDNGAQPMYARRGDERFVIVYNGELYNTEEIRAELVSLGYGFNGRSDTEVLLTAYIAWGEACLDRMNGIFAFAIWNEREKTLFLARDRMGVKPLFYCEYSGGIVFASELKALLKTPKVQPIIDAEGVADIMLLGPARRPGYGVFKNVSELKLSECAVFNEYGLKKRSYWQLRAAEHKQSLKETEENIAFLINDAIKRQLVSDVPLCTFLSGGLDSSIISAVAAKEYAARGDKLTTYSIDYVDNAKNFKASSFQPDMDAPWILKMVEHIGSDHINVELDTRELTDALGPSTIARDLPGMADVDSSLYLFCREIKKNYTVAISGECADEIFGGYPWYHNEEILFQKGFPWARSARDRAGLLKEGVLGSIDPYEYIDVCCNETLKQTDYLDTDTPAERRMREMFMLNIHWFMQTLLDRKDRMSMAWGLEVRVPFCDHRIARYAYNVPWEYKAERGREKGLVRSAMTGVLPDDVLWRKKSPYPKTHNPAYLSEVIKRTRAILSDKDCRMTDILDRKKLEQLCDDPTVFKNNWYGQLMTAPQVFA
ncbi:MAG: asparagine synthase (glutamine-hydrolyzing), partial [Eubacterium sp.]|nr:asparagine synthase (glutamine-hydrolyzing) [Eubacterium sp.]